MDSCDIGKEYPANTLILDCKERALQLFLKGVVYFVYLVFPYTSFEILFIYIRYRYCDVYYIRKNSQVVTDLLQTSL